MKLRRETKTPQEWTKVAYIGIAPALFILVSIGMIAMFENMAYQVIAVQPTATDMFAGFAGAVAIVSAQIVTTVLALGIFEILQENHSLYLLKKNNSKI